MRVGADRSRRIRGLYASLGGVVKGRMMHDCEVNCIVANAFNGIGDAIGDDEFGVSIAWIDLQDFLEGYGGTELDGDELSEALIAYTGSRWVLAYLWADGRRDFLACETATEMREVFESWSAEYAEYLDGVES